MDPRACLPACCPANLMSSRPVRAPVSKNQGEILEKDSYACSLTAVNTYTWAALHTQTYHRDPGYIPESLGSERPALALQVSLRSDCGPFSSSAPQQPQNCACPARAGTIAMLSHGRSDLLCVLPAPSVALCTANVCLPDGGGAQSDPGSQRKVSSSHSYSSDRHLR